MSQVATLKKPQLRGLLHSQIKKNLIVAIGLCIVAGVAHRFTVVEPRRNKYAEFYKTYNPYKDFDRMRNKGLFDSCEPDN